MADFRDKGSFDFLNTESGSVDPPVWDAVPVESAGMEDAPAVIDPMDPEPLVKQLMDEFVMAIGEMASQAGQVLVVDDASNERAVGMTTQAKAIAQAIGKKRVALKAPYLAVTSTLDGFCKRLTDQLGAIQAGLNAKIRPYLQKLEADRVAREKEAREEAARVQAELDRQAKDEAARVAASAREEALATGADEKAASEFAASAAAAVERAPVAVAAAVPAETVTKTDAGTAKLKTKTEWEIVDFRVLPDALFAARGAQLRNAAAPWINAQIKAGVRAIPGVRVFESQVVDTRTRR